MNNFLLIFPFFKAMLNLFPGLGGGWGGGGEHPQRSYEIGDGIWYFREGGPEKGITFEM